MSTGDARNLLLELRLPARARELKRIRDAVRKTVKEAGCGKQCAGDIVMAVDEACQNIIRHAYGVDRSGEILLEVERQGEDLVFSLVDFAPRIDPARVKPRDLDDVRPGGLGTHLIRKVMDSADFIEPPPGCGNLLRMVKRIE
jgi:sigma-B regulation protein RsbU (phosphoserine phosphatase)